MPDDDIPERVGKMTLGQLIESAKEAFKLIGSAAAVAVALWTPMWSYVVRPAIAQVTQEELGDKIAQLEAQVNELLYNQSTVTNSQARAEADQTAVLQILTEMAEAQRQLTCLQQTGAVCP